MVLSKKDLVLIGDFIPNNYPKMELNFALVGRGGIYASDTIKMIKFHFPSVSGEEVLCHKKLLKGFTSLLGKDDEATLDEDCILKFSDVEFDMATCSEDRYTYPESIEDTLDTKLEKHFVLDSLDDVGLELASKNCFIADCHLLPLIKHGVGDKFDVFFTSMDKKDAGRAKIVSTVFRDDEEEVILYTALISGRIFHSEAK